MSNVDLYNELQNKLLKYQDSIFINYNEFLSLLQTNSKSMTPSSDIGGIAESLRKASQLTYPDISGIAENVRKTSQQNYPDIGGIAESLRKASQLTYPDIGGVIENFIKGSQLTYPDISGITENVRKASHQNYPDIGGIAKSLRKASQLTYPDIGGVIENFIKGSQVTHRDINIILSSITNFQIEIEKFDFNEKDMKEANEILESDNPAERVKREMSIKDYIPKPVWVIIIMLYFLMDFLNNVAGVINFVEEKIPIVMESYEEYITQNHNVSDRESIKWLNDVIKKETEQQITQNFRIVTKNNLIVRENKKVNSKSQGSLSHGDVVQIIEKKRNWTYIHFSDHEENTVIEGWVFTRYLKQIK